MSLIFIKTPSSNGHTGIFRSLFCKKSTENGECMMSELPYSVSARQKMAWDCMKMAELKRADKTASGLSEAADYLVQAAYYFTNFSPFKPVMAVNQLRKAGWLFKKAGDVNEARKCFMAGAEIMRIWSEADPASSAEYDSFRSLFSKFANSLPTNGNTKSPLTLADRIL